MKNAVVITDAPRVNYMHNYVVLPYYYGSERYFNRPDIKAIRETVYKSLDTLDKETGFCEKFRGRKVLVKPNLVAVMHKAGNTLDDVPQTTDPRVFEAVISYLKRLTDHITIVEGAGKGISTMQSFKDVGLDRVAEQYGCKLVAVEEQPLDHYYVPKAEVQKDVYLPRIFSEVVRGEALYVSVPKMKTNLYTGVTLGFKNAMGVLSGNMRYRNHSWQIEKKLVDLLYLFKPDLTVVDGIIGGEGLTPAAVDPVKVGMIVTGTNSVEVDRVVTRIMGIDPETLNLMKEAKVRNFGDPDVKVIGDMRIVPFRKADCSLLSDRFRRNWPNVRYFVGHTNSRAPKIDDVNSVTPQMVYEIEGACRGGCLPTLAMFMEMLHKGKTTYNPQLEFAVLRGNGCVVGDERYWFDADGKPYNVEALKALNLNIVGCGSCTEPAHSACSIYGGGCCNVGELAQMFMKATKQKVPMLSMGNEGFTTMLTGMMRKYFAVRKVIRQGDIVEIPFDAKSDGIFPIPELSDEDMQKDWIFVPMEKCTPMAIKTNLKEYKMIQVG
jgi:uncharacterized protein (DUF362 family)